MDNVINFNDQSVVIGSNYILQTVYSEADKKLTIVVQEETSS